MVKSLLRQFFIDEVDKSYEVAWVVDRISLQKVNIRHTLLLGYIRNAYIGMLVAILKETIANKNNVEHFDESV
jgi:hypothetical protein